MDEIPCVRVRVLKAVLQFQLRVRGEAVAERGIDAPKIVPPAGASAKAIRNNGKELLIPAQRAKELRGELVFSLEIVGKGIGVTHARNLETDLVKLSPQLQMMQ